MGRKKLETVRNNERHRGALGGRVGKRDAERREATRHRLCAEECKALVLKGRKRKGGKKRKRTMHKQTKKKAINQSSNGWEIILEKVKEGRKKSEIVETNEKGKKEKKDKKDLSNNKEKQKKRRRDDWIEEGNSVGIARF